jgi:acetolactate decarboxylase
MRVLFVFTLLAIFYSHCFGQNPVKIAGSMREAMWQGKLGAVIDLDTIADNRDLNGVGPVEFLTGEILIIDGKAFKSSVTSDTSMHVEQTFKIKAPFFVYATVNQWQEVIIPDSVHTIAQLERYLNNISKTMKQPFAFKLSGVVKEATFHVVNLSPGTEVRSPKQSHAGKRNFRLQNEEVQIIGFFSTEHQGVFTHHDSFIHMHLITTDLQKMGHVDQLYIEKDNVNLYLPIK